MPTYEVELDDGRVLEVDADREPTPDEIYSAMGYARDTGQSVLDSIGSAAARGIASIPKGIVGGTGALSSMIPGLENNAFQRAGRGMGEWLEETFPINQAVEQSFPVKAAGAFGQGLGFLGTTLATGGLGATPAIAARIGLGTAGLLGAEQGAELAEQYGVEDPWKRRALIAGGGVIEGVSERAFGGFGTVPFTRALLGKMKSATRPGSAFVRGGKTILGEAAEEPLAGELSDQLTKGLIQEDPNNPGFATNGQPLPPEFFSEQNLKNRLEEAALGGIGGAVFAGAEALGSRTSIQEAIALRAEARKHLSELEAKGILPEEQAEVDQLKAEDANVSTWLAEKGLHEEAQDDAVNRYTAIREEHEAKTRVKEIDAEIDAIQPTTPEQNEQIEALKTERAAIVSDVDTRLAALHKRTLEAKALDAAMGSKPANDLLNTAEGIEQSGVEDASRSTAALKELAGNIATGAAVDVVEESNASQEEVPDAATTTQETTKAQESGEIEALLSSVQDEQLKTDLALAIQRARDEAASRAAVAAPKEPATYPAAPVVEEGNLNEAEIAKAAQTMERGTTESIPPVIAPNVQPTTAEAPSEGLGASSEAATQASQEVAAVAGAKQARSEPVAAPAGEKLTPEERRKLQTDPDKKAYAVVPPRSSHPFQWTTEPGSGVQPEKPVEKVVKSLHALGIGTRTSGGYQDTGKNPIPRTIVTFERGKVGEETLGKIFRVLQALPMVKNQSVNDGEISFEYEWGGVDKAKPLWWKSAEATTHANDAWSRVESVLRDDLSPTPAAEPAQAPAKAEAQEPPSADTHESRFRAELTGSKAFPSPDLVDAAWALESGDTTAYDKLTQVQRSVAGRAFMDTQGWKEPVKKKTARKVAGEKVQATESDEDWLAKQSQELNDRADAESSLRVLADAEIDRLADEGKIEEANARRRQIRDEVIAELRGKGFKNLKVGTSKAGFIIVPKALQGAVDYGRELIRNGTTSAVKWGRAMIAKFGDAIRKRLSRIWNHITSGVKTLLAKKPGGAKVGDADGERLRETGAGDQSAARVEPVGEGDQHDGRPDSKPLLAKEPVARAVNVLRTTLREGVRSGARDFKIAIETVAEQFRHKMVWTKEPGSDPSFAVDQSGNLTLLLPEGSHEAIMSMEDGDRDLWVHKLAGEMFAYKATTDTWREAAKTRPTSFRNWMAELYDELRQRNLYQSTIKALWDTARRDGLFTNDTVRSVEFRHGLAPVNNSTPRRIILLDRMMELGARKTKTQERRAQFNAVRNDLDRIQAERDSAREAMKTLFMPAHGREVTDKNLHSVEAAITKTIAGVFRNKDRFIKAQVPSHLQLDGKHRLILHAASNLFGGETVMAGASIQLRDAIRRQFVDFHNSAKAGHLGKEWQALATGMEAFGEPLTYAQEAAAQFTKPVQTVPTQDQEGPSLVPKTPGVKETPGRPVEEGEPLVVPVVGVITPKQTLAKNVRNVLAKIADAIPQFGLGDVEADNRAVAILRRDVEVLDIPEIKATFGERASDAVAALKTGVSEAAKAPGQFLKFTATGINESLNEIDEMLGGEDDTRFAAQPLTAGASDANDPYANAANDPKTGLPTHITGKRVTAAQAGAATVAIREASKAVRYLLSLFERDVFFVNRPGDQIATLKEELESQHGENYPRTNLTLADFGVRFTTIPKSAGAPAQQTATSSDPDMEFLGGGVESAAFHHKPTETVYLFTQPMEWQGAFGYGVRGTHQMQAGKLNIGMDVGTPATVLQKIEFLNGIQGIPAEFVGITTDGTMVTKKPLGTTTPGADERIDNYLAAYPGVHPDPARVFGREVGADKATLEKVAREHGGVPLNGPNINAMGATFAPMVFHVNGIDFVASDVRVGNVAGDNSGRLRIMDAAITEIDAAAFPNVPELQAAIAEARRLDAARGNGSVEFAASTGEADELLAGLPSDELNSEPTPHADLTRQERADLAAAQQAIDDSPRTRSRGIVLEIYGPGRLREHRFARALALLTAITGRRVIFVGDKGGAITAFSGFHPTGNDDLIVINKDAIFGLINTVGHEWFHTLPRAQRDAFIAEVNRQLKDGSLPFLQDRLRALNYAENQISEEIAANVAGDIFMQPEFWRELKDSNRPLWKRLVDSVLDWFDGVVAKMKGGYLNTPAHIKDIAALRKSLVALMNGNFSLAAQIGLDADYAAQEDEEAEFASQPAEAEDYAQARKKAFVQRAEKAMGQAVVEPKWKRMKRLVRKLQRASDPSAESGSPTQATLDERTHKHSGKPVDFYREKLSVAEINDAAKELLGLSAELSNGGLNREFGPKVMKFLDERSVPLPGIPSDTLIKSLIARALKQDKNLLTDLEVDIKEVERTHSSQLSQGSEIMRSGKGVYNPLAKLNEATQEYTQKMEADMGVDAEKMAKTALNGTNAALDEAVKSLTPEMKQHLLDVAQQGLDTTDWYEGAMPAFDERRRKLLERLKAIMQKINDRLGELGGAEMAAQEGAASRSKAEKRSRDIIQAELDSLVEEASEVLAEFFGKPKRTKKTSPEKAVREIKAVVEAAERQTFKDWVGGASQEGINDFTDLVLANSNANGFSRDAFAISLTNKFSEVDPEFISSVADKIQELLDAKVEEPASEEKPDWDAKSKKIIADAVTRDSMPDTGPKAVNALDAAIKARLKNGIDAANIFQAELDRLNVEEQTAFALNRKVEEDIAAREAAKLARKSLAEQKRAAEKSEKEADAETERVKRKLWNKPTEQKQASEFQNLTKRYRNVEIAEAEFRNELAKLNVDAKTADRLIRWLNLERRNKGVVAWTAIRENVRNAREKAILKAEAMMKPAKPREKAQRSKFVRNLMAAMEAGVLDSRRVTEAFADAYELHGLTEERMQNLAEIVRNIEQMKDGIPRQTLFIRVLDLMNELAPPQKFMDFIADAVTAGVLGKISTSTAQYTGVLRQINPLQATFQLMWQLPSNQGQFLKFLNPGNWTTFAKIWGNYVSELGRAAYASPAGWKGFFGGEAAGLGVNPSHVVDIKPTGMRVGALKPGDLHTMRVGQSRAVNALLGWTPKSAAGKNIKFALMLGAWWSSRSFVAIRGAEALAGMVDMHMDFKRRFASELMRRGATLQKAWAQASDMLNAKSNDQMWIEAREQAKKEQKSLNFSTLQLTARATEIVQDRIDDEMTLNIANKHREMSAYLNYKSRPVTRAGTGWVDLTNKAKNTVTPLKSILLFQNFFANIFEKAIFHSPLGYIILANRNFANAAHHALKPHEQQVLDIFGSAEEYKSARAGMATIGTLFGGLAAALGYALWKWSDDDEDKTLPPNFWITGGLPHGEAYGKQRQLEMGGWWKPLTAYYRLPGQKEFLSISYANAHPELAIIMNLIGNFADRAMFPELLNYSEDTRTGERVYDVNDAVWKPAAGGLLAPATRNTYVETQKAVTDMFDGKPRRLMKLLGKPFGEAAMSLVPLGSGLIGRDIAGQFKPEVPKASQNPMQAFLQGMPYVEQWDEWLGAPMNTGIPLVNEGGLPVTQFHYFPFISNPQKTTPEIAKMANTLTDLGIFKQSMQEWGVDYNRVEIANNGQRFIMDFDTRARALKEIGQRFASSVNRDAAKLKKMPLDDAKKAVSKMHQDARAEVLGRMRATTPK